VSASSARPHHESDVPVTGAWRPGDPVADRRFITFAQDRRFFLEGGGSLRDVTIAYETWGELADDASNAVLVCHALTGDAHAAGRSGAGQPSPGWWDDVIGPGKALDTTRLFVVCANVLGGCQGSTGPASIDPATGRPYGSSFPQVSIRDMVRTQAVLADRLGVDRWHCVIGGSMGGMQALEWGVMYPLRVRSLVLMATAAAATAQQIAFSAIERNAVMLDPNWRGGDYYDAPPNEGPHRGLMLARQLAQVTYRTDEVFSQKFGREVIDPLDRFTLDQRFNVENYLDYQGNKLVRRFDANSYLAICKAMDLHDVGRGRGGIDRALARVVAPTLTVSINSDALYYPYQQEQIRDALRSGGTRCEHVVIDSPDGHDAFLLAIDQLAASLGRFLDEVEKSDDR
jgi:homoserine O-acetyltransferase/O-succinyltransferase